MTMALVTGGARGIGAAVCRALAADGLPVLVADLDGTAAARVAAELPGSGHAGCAVDVVDEASVAALFDAAPQPVTVLVTCAGIMILDPDGQRAPIAEMALDVWQTTEAVNGRGTFLCCREYARRLPEDARGGRVVTVSSLSAMVGGIRASAAYTASKAAVLGLTKAFARELAPRGITVNTVAPGLIDTAMLSMLGEASNGPAAAASVPLGRIGTVDDVAACVRFLVSPGAAYVTGSTLHVNGGLFMA